MGILIGVTSGEIFNKIDPWSPVTNGQSETYIDAVTRAGGVPLIFPISTDPEVLRSMYNTVSGILLSGGNDLNPELYGEKPLATTIDISKRRDTCEQLLIKWALEDDKPILAICRGMQILNVTCGGTLYQHIPTMLPNAQDHTGSTAAKNIEHIAHALTIDADSKLSSIIGSDPINTNAHHHQAIMDIASNLRATAWAEDGIIEALESINDTFVVGVQSHPESLVNQAEPRWRKLFEAFVEASE